MIYFDNAATTFPKPNSVYEAVLKCLKHYCGNPGRSSHTLSIKSAEVIYDTRERVSNLLGVSKPENVVFTYNATYAINLALKTLIKGKCHVLTSDVEHNSVIRPLEKLRRVHGIEYSLFDSDDPERSIEDLVRGDTVGIVSTLASNVTGAKIPLEILSDAAKKHNLFLIVDSSQLIGHARINLSKTPCDCLCAPAHKALFGIQGCGFAYFADSIRGDSFIEGGSGNESLSPQMPLLLPEGYEAGTLATPAIASLEAGIRFIEDVGIDNIDRQIDRFTVLLAQRLKSIDKVKLYSARGGIVSFGVADVPSSVISDELDRFGICVRGGLHCAPSAHKKLGTLDKGAVRASLSFLNTITEIEEFHKALSYVVGKY